MQVGPYSEQEAVDPEFGRALAFEQKEQQHDREEGHQVRPGQPMEPSQDRGEGTGTVG